MLLGAWPAELTGESVPDAEVLRGFAERIEAAMIKSIREAKLHTSWASPNATYEEAVLGFVRDALDPSRSGFLRAFLPFEERVARLGVSNSLVQTALKLTLPGMPDIYQGAELWDLSLVDPDNRRPVDYDARLRLLDRVTDALRHNRRTALQEMRKNWRDGRLKLAVISTLLAHRAARPALFVKGKYEPLAADGDRSDEVCAFARTQDKTALIVVAARFPVRQEIKPDWVGTSVTWSKTGNSAALWRDLLTGQVFERSGKALDISALLADLPVAALVPQSEGGA